MSDQKINQINSALSWRYATKKFDSNKKIPAQSLTALENALCMAPSSYGLQPWKFLIVSNSELRIKLRAAAWDQAQITDCSHLVVVTAHEKISPKDVRFLIEEVAKTRKTSITNLTGYEKMLNEFLVETPDLKPWSSRQCYIALGFLLFTAAILQIDACPMEGFEPEKFDELLKLKGTGYGSVAICALGYRSSADKVPVKARLPRDKTVLRIE